MMGCRNYLALLALTLSAAMPLPASAQSASRAVPEYVMKAAYLYNFVLLAEWPPTSHLTEASSLNLCLYGGDELNVVIEQLRSKMVDGTPVRVRRVSDPSEVNQCHLLFVGEADGSRGTRLLEAARNLPVLTVSDDNRQAQNGVILMIAAESQRLTFEVDLNAARKSQLKLSSKLLRLAKRVNGQ
jgi:hypothetical protein